MINGAAAAPANAATGFGYLLRGFRLITQPGIRAYAVVPLLVTVVIYVLLIVVATVSYSDLLHHLLPSGDAWWVAVLRIVLWPLFALALLFVMYFTFTLLANLVGAPFNGLLAERVEAYVRGEATTVQGSSIAAALKDFVPALFNELRKFVYYLAWAIPLLILFIIPLVNVAAPILWGVFMAWILALEYAAYPAENHGLRFKTVRASVGGRRSLALGFGAGVLGAMVIPGVNLLVMPAAVAGATAMWVERLSAPVGAPGDTAVAGA